MDTISSFIPMDRRFALARGAELPERATGAALFADIAGFTPLAEALAAQLGPQRGAEELTDRLNDVYGRLTALIDYYGGSVIGFSGDALTCWFDDRVESRDWRVESREGASQSLLSTLQSPAELRAVACALAMQAAMAGVGELAIKVAVAYGPVRRFLLGDPRHQLIEALAGPTLDRLAAAEHLARQGEVVLDSQAAGQLGASLTVAEWRIGEAAGERYAVVGSIAEPARPRPWPALPPEALPHEKARPWLLPSVYDQLRTGHGEFLTELRPVITLFLRFGGLNYDDATAGNKLDAYLRWAQEVVSRYEGTLLQLTIGDKGSYLYATFGAPLAHADDPARAVGAALELRRPPPDLASINVVQIGIAGGRARAGAYGGTTRTYGVQGDAVNLAARLMQAAAPGQILIEERLSAAIERRYALEPLPPIRLKGKREPVTVAAVVGARPTPAIHLQEPRYTLPLVGRTAILEQIEDHLAMAAGGHGQILGITADAGMGKSRLVAEIVRRAADHGFAAYGGEAQSHGTRSAYLAWRPLWHMLFGLDASAPPHTQAADLERALAEVDPALLPRLPLLGGLLELPIHESDLVRSMDLALRKEALEQMLAGYLKVRAAGAPLLLVLEDAHWLDPLSVDLLTAIGHSIAGLPMLLAITRRPPDAHHPDPLPALTLAHATELRLGELTNGEAHELIVLRANALFDTPQALPPEFTDQLIARAQGNPFYIEELLNYAWSSGLAGRDAAAWARANPPDSLASLVLSRIDQLTAEQQTIIKVASVIGRTFPVAWLWGVHPNLGPGERVHADLEELTRLGLAVRAAPEPEPRYLFKHVLIQEIAYDSLPFALRAHLHNELARWLEERADAQESLDLLAFHYGRSANHTKQREYYRRAGDAAAARFANATAIDYYERLLELLPIDEQGEALVSLGDVLERIGAYADANARYHEALSIADTTNDRGTRAQAQRGQGMVQWRRGEYSNALDWLYRARANCLASGDTLGATQTLLQIAQVLMFQGETSRARALAEEAQALALAHGDLLNAGRALHLLGNLAANRNELPEAHAFWSKSIELKRAIGDTMGVAATLANMGLRAHDASEYDDAQAMLEESLRIFHEAGARQQFILARSTLVQIRLAKGDLADARRLLMEDLALLRELGARWEMALDFVALAEVSLAEATTAERARCAARLNGAAAGLLASIGATFFVINDRARVERIRATCRNILGEVAEEAAWNEGQHMDWPEALNYALGLQQGVSNERSRAA
jgi:class 3 adenylate cyclase/tetratricopeptide (TPR) repeat protein